MEREQFQSKVPRTTFPETLAEQKVALEADPVMKRFAESRRAFAYLGTLHIWAYLGTSITVVKDPVPQGFSFLRFFLPWRRCFSP